MNGRRRGKERHGKGSGVFDSATFHLAAPINRRSRCDGSQPRIDPARDRITERERREASRSSIGSVFSPSPRRRIISPPLPRDKLPRGAAPSLLFSPLPPPSLFLSLSSPAPETDRPSDRSIRHSLRRHRWTVAAPDNNGAGGRERKKGRGREGGRGKTAL